MTMQGRSLTLVAAVICASLAVGLGAAPNACKNTPLGWGSNECLCTATQVSCAYTKFTEFPNKTSIPPNVETFLFFGNNITQGIGNATSASDYFSNFTMLQTIDLHSNNMPVVNLAISQLKSLRTLYLYSNKITTIPSNMFAILNLTIEDLRLDDNRLTSLASNTFFAFGALRVLYLHMNNLTSLPDTLFTRNTQLTKLLLNQNQLTQLPTTLFRNQTLLREIHLELNGIFVVSQGTFDNLRSIANLSMAGNPTDCIVNGTGRVYCRCALGYVGNTTNYCEPINCTSRISSLDPNAISNCSGDTRYLGNNCSVSCRPGYLPAGAPSYYCDLFGVWQGAFTCTPIQCGTQIQSLDPHATATCSGNTRFDGDACTATCATGYLGGSQRYTCGTNGTWMGNLTCRVIDCGALTPSDPNGRAACSNTTLGALCNASCADGFLGGPSTFTCLASGVWDGFLACTGADCGRTIQSGLAANASARCRGDTTYQGRPCVATCDEGFVGNPVTFTCARNGSWVSNTSMSCAKVNCGSTLPATLATYDCGNNTFYQDTCNATCLPGYVASPANYTQFNCTSVAVWDGSINCTAVSCGATIPSLDPRAVLTCNNITRYDLSPSQRGLCVATCQTGYRFISAVNASVADHVVGGVTVTGVSYSCEASARWTGPERLCEAVPCPALTLDTKVYNLTCPPSRRQFNGGACSLRCGDGFQPTNLTFLLTCGANGTWEGDFECTVIPPPKAATTASSSSSPMGLIVGAVIGGIILIIIIAVLARKRRRKVDPAAAALSASRTRTRSVGARPVEYEDTAVVGMTTNPLHRKYGGAQAPQEYEYQSGSHQYDVDVTASSKTMYQTQKVDGNAAVVAGWDIPLG